MYIIEPCILIGRWVCDAAITQAFMRASEHKKNLIGERARLEGVKESDLSGRQERERQQNLGDLTMAIKTIDSLSVLIQKRMSKVEMRHMNENIDVLYQLEQEFGDIQEIVSAVRKQKFK